MATDLQLPIICSLSVIAGTDLGKIFTLYGRVIIVGRSEHADFQINEIAAAPRQFEMRWSPEKYSYQIKHIGGVNDVILNNLPLKFGQEAELNDNDHISIGGTVLLYKFTIDIAMAISNAIASTWK